MRDKDNEEDIDFERCRKEERQYSGIDQSLYRRCRERRYPTLLGFTGTEIGRLCGYNEVLYSCDTYQFSDYSRYDCNMFLEEKKREQKEKQFPIDLQKAYELGKRLTEKAKEAQS